MPIPVVMNRVSARVLNDAIFQAAGSKIRKGQAVYLVGSEQAVPGGSITDQATSFFQVGLPDVDGSDDLAVFGIAFINYPYQDFIPRATVEGETIEQMSQTTDFLKGMITVAREGGAWVRVEQPYHATDPALQFDFNDSVKLSDRHSGSIMPYVPATVAELEAKMGKVMSGLFKEPSREAEQWASNQLEVPASASDPNNVGWVYIDLQLP
jgi:hypothetical protein